MQKNKYGLSRYIPSSVRRKLRKEAGFGCVICGIAICQYEHIDPEFSDAREHDPEKMAFLCGQCHTKVTIGQISKETVSKAKLQPKALQKGFSFEAFDVGDTHPIVQLGPMIAKDCDYTLRINGRPVIWVNTPEEIGGPFRLNAELRDGAGNLNFSIRDNVWVVKPELWDCEVVGKQITIRSDTRILLQITTTPPNKISFDRIDFIFEGHRIFCNGKLFEIQGSNNLRHSAKSLEIGKFECAVELCDSQVIFGSNGKPGNYASLSGRINEPVNSLEIDLNLPRNERCLCGSGKKYKHCCGRL